MSDKNGRPNMAERLMEFVDEAHAALARGDLPGARQAHARACKVDPRDISVLLVEVDLLEAEGSEEEALGAASEALAAFPGDPAVKLRMAVLILDVFDDAEAAHELLVGADADLQETGHDADGDQDLHVEVLVTLADCLGALQKNQDARETIERAKAIAPKNRDVILSGATQDWMTGLADDALSSVEALLESEPNTADGLFLKGRILSTLGRYDESDAAHERAAELDPDLAVMQPLGDEEWASIWSDLKTRRADLAKRVRGWTVEWHQRAEEIGDAKLQPVELMTRLEGDRVAVFTRNFLIAADDYDDLVALFDAVLGSLCGAEAA